MAEFFENAWGFPTPLAYLVAGLIHCALLIHVVAVGALVFIWMERKVSGRIQDRLGPTRVGGAFGWLQTLADGLKLITKEDITPRDADHILFKLAPYVSFAASFTAYMALPFADGWVGVYVNSGVFLILAILGLEVFGVILAGYASGSKWSLFGAMREAAQVVSYEVPLGMCVVVPVMICGTMNLTAIGQMQAGWFWNWLVFHDVFTLMVFFVYITCATASVNRAPFDLAEAESELVAGFHTEYSGLRWSFFFMAEYGSMFLVSGLASILFLGGWNGPIPVTQIIHDIFVDNLGFQLGSWAPLWGYLANLLGCMNFILKAVLGVTAMMWARWTLPRLRIDQVMTTCLKYCVPLAAIGFIGALVWQLREWPTLNNVNRGMVREHWTRIAADQTAAVEPTKPAAPSAPSGGEEAPAEHAPAAEEAASLPELEEPPHRRRSAVTKAQVEGLVPRNDSVGGGGD